MNDERLEKLLDAYFDQALEEAERTELEYLLLSSSQARQVFWQRARFHALLRRHGMENWGVWLAENAMPSAETEEEALPNPPAFPPSHPERGSLWPRLPGWITTGLRWAPLAAAVAGLLIAVLFWPKPEVEQPLAYVPPKPKLTMNPPVAELVQAVGVVWTDATDGRNAGAVLGTGSLKIEQGLVEVQFYRGARVVIEGPAEFELVSDMEARCHSGKIRVEVSPPAHGFKVLSPSLEVIDLGTSFGMNVRPDGQAEIHVFQGKVEMTSVAAPRQLRALAEGESALVSANGQVHPAEMASAAFVSWDEIGKRAATEMQQRYRAWQAYSARLQQDPALLLSYDFEGQPPGGRTLPNRSRQAPPESNGTIIGCQWAEGRWPGKAALDFKQFGDRVRFTLPGEFRSLTCLAWVRVDGLSHRLSALMMSGKARAGEPQWQLVQTGTIQFGKRILDGWGVEHMENCQSGTLIEPEQMGLWMHIAVVYDIPSRTVRHYFNGKEVSNGPITSTLPVTLEAMEIGNWTPQIGQPMEPIRNFNGRLDDFLIFGRALSPDEIQHAYAIGRPM